MPRHSDFVPRYTRAFCVVLVCHWWRGYWWRGQKLGEVNGWKISQLFLRVSSVTDLHEGLRAPTKEISNNSTTRSQSSILWYITAALIDSRCSKMIYLVTCSGLPHQTSKAWCKKVRGDSLGSPTRMLTDKESQLLHLQATKAYISNNRPIYGVVVCLQAWNRKYRRKMVIKTPPFILSADLVASHRPPRNTEGSYTINGHKLNNTTMNSIPRCPLVSSLEVSVVKWLTWLFPQTLLCAYYTSTTMKVPRQALIIILHPHICKITDAEW